MEQSRQHRLQVVASIEAISDLSEIAVAVLRERKGVESTGECSLQVRSQRIDPMELRMFGRLGAVPGDVGLMALHQGGERLNPRPTVGEHQALRRNHHGRPLLDSRDAGVIHPVKAHDLRATFQIGLNSGHEGYFVATPPLTTGLLTAQEGVIKFEAPEEHRSLLALKHHLHELVANQPRGGIAHPKVALKRAGANAALAVRHPEHGEKLRRERQFGVLHDAAHDRGAPVATVFALPESATVVRRAKSGALTAITDKAVGPERLDYGGFALRVRPIVMQKLSQ